MANRDTPFGLRLFVQAHDQPLYKVVIPATDSGLVGIGDAVKIAGSSGVAGSGPQAPTVARCAAGDPIFGVVQGFDHIDVAVASRNDTIMHRPASVAMYALIRIANHEDIYEVQCDDVGGDLAGADIGLNADLVVADCDAVTGISAMELDTSSKATTATLQLHIIGFSPAEDNVVASTNQKVLVTLNNIQSAGGTGVAGV